MSSNQGDVANTFRTFCQMLRYMSLDNACDAVSSLSRGFADLRIPAREWRLPFFVSRNISISALDVRRRRPSWPDAPTSWTRAEGHPRPRAAAATGPATERPPLHPLEADALPRDLRQRYLRAKRRMISLNIGSVTFSAACEAESHFTTRSCFSGHCLFWRLTSSGKTRTSQTTTPPFLIRFSYENEPAARLATAPTTQPLRKLHAQPNTGATCPFSASPSE